MEHEKETAVSSRFSLYATRRLGSITLSSRYLARHLQASIPIPIPMTTLVEAQRWRSRLFVGKT